MKTITKQQTKEIAALKKLKDSDIDLSDIPELTGWSNRVVGKFYRPIKQPVTIRLDADILAWCRQHVAVAVTLDADFHAAIALSGESAPSAIRLRIQGLKGPETARLLLDILPAREAQLTAGALITVQHGRLRVRSLPVARKSE